MFAWKTSMGFDIQIISITASLTAAVFMAWTALKIPGDINFLRDQMDERSLEESG